MPFYIPRGLGSALSRHFYVPTLKTTVCLSVQR